MNPNPEHIRASAVARDLPLSAEAKALLNPDQTAHHFLGVLEGSRLFADAITFMARWLPIRESLWWGAQCIWHLQQPMPTEAEAEAMRAVVQWAVEPNDKHRRAAGDAGEEATMSTAAGRLATAVFWSGGSISEPNLPAVEPPAFAAATVVGKTLLAATAVMPNEEGEQQLALKLGMQVAQGRNRWDSQLVGTTA